MLRGMDTVATIFRLSDLYCAHRGCAEATLSTRLFGDGKRLGAIRSGSDVGVRRAHRALAWFAANWPADLKWPDDIVRPAAAPSEAAE